MGNDQSVVKYSPSSTQRMCFGYLSELLLIPRCHESRPSRRRVHARGRRCLCPGQRVHARSRAPVGLPRPRAIYLPTWRLADRRSAPLETESEASLAAPPTGRRHGGGQPPSHQTRVVPPARHWEPRLHGCAVLCTTRANPRRRSARWGAAPLQPRRASDSRYPRGKSAETSQAGCRSGKP